MAEIKTQKAMIQLKQVFKDLNDSVSAAQKLWIIQAALLIEKEAKNNVAKTVGKNVKIKGLTRTGQLMNSITHEIKMDRHGFSAIVGPTVKYARIQEEGGIIKPTRASKLFIPLTRRGQRIGPSRGGDKRLKWGIDFVLADQAKRDPKPYMAPAFESTKSQVVNLLSQILDRELS